MSSATNTVGLLTTMKQSTAAIRVSFTGNLKADAKTSGSKADFDSILGQLGSQKNGEASQKPEVVSTKDVKNDTTDYSKTPNEVETNTEKVTQTPKEDTKKPVDTKETDGKEAENELQNAISEDGKKLIRELSEMTNVTEDEIIAAMQMLGITDMNLLNPENIIQIVNEVLPEENGIDLIADTQLSGQLGDILKDAKDMKEQIVEDFDITQEDLEEAIKNPEPKQEPVKAENKEEVEVTFVKVEPKDQDVDKLFKPLDKVEFTRSDEHIDTIRPLEETASETSQNSQNKGSDLTKGNEGSGAFNQLLGNIVDAAVEDIAPTENPYTARVQMEDIIRQITDRITVSKGPEETSMELQLHPANLGHVNILLTSGKDGITAKFTAQNEIVKEAVEAQMVQLQQKFSEQGIKVTSIEVTIASHAFEQNLDQQGENQSAKEQMEKNRKSLRRINLSALDEEEIEDEADALVKEMMAINGNSIDYSA